MWRLRTSLGAKFIAVTVLLTVISVLTVGAIGLTLAKRGIRTHTNFHLQSAVDLKSDAIQIWLSSERALVDSGLYPEGSSDSVSLLLSSSPGSQPDMETQRRLDSRIGPLLAQRTTSNGTLILEGVQILDASNAPRYAMGKVLDLEVDFSTEELSHGQTGMHFGFAGDTASNPDTSAVILSWPLEGTEGTVLAFVNMEVIHTLMQPDDGLGGQGRFYLARTGDVILGAEGALPPVASSLNPAALLTEPGLGNFSQNGVEMVGVAKALPDLPWILVAALPEREAFADAAQIQRTILLSIAGVALVAGFVALAMIRNITGPLKALAAGSRRFGSGDMSVRLQVTSRDEVGTVAATFNEMAEDIGRLYRDITRERLTLEAVQNSMTEGLIVVDMNGIAVYCNEAAADILGTGSAGVVGLPAAQILDVEAQDPGTREAIEELIVALSDVTAIPKSVEAEFSNSQRMVLSITAFPIAAAPEGAMVGLLLRDITEERDAVRRRDAFVSIASHELRTPMTALLGFTELLLQRNPSDKVRRDWLLLIHREALRLSAVLDDLLNVSHIQSGKITIDLKPVIVAEVVGKVLEGVQGTTNDHQFAIEASPDASPVLADQGKLEQILMNLLSNAVKYSPEGGPITVSVRNDPGQDRVIVGVADRGMGIDPADQGLLFTSFHRIERPETAAIKGTGLGLSIVKGLTELMHGEIWVESEVNRGSTFYLSLPTAGARVPTPLEEKGNPEEGEILADFGKEQPPGSD